jgi:hypothetical protein
MTPANEIAAKPHAADSDEESVQQLRTILDNLQRVSPAAQDNFHSGIVDSEASEREAIYDRPVAVENEMKKRAREGSAATLSLS